MTVVKQSSISSRVEDEFRSSVVGKTHSGSLFSASEVMGCPKKAILDLNAEKCSGSAGSDNVAFRHFIYRSDMFEVIREDVSLSSMEMGVECVVDMLVRYLDEHVLINIRENDSSNLPLSGDVMDMVASMYSAGVWSGLLCYVDNSGCRVFFVNPDRADARKILSTMAERGKSLLRSRMAGIVPEGEVGSQCSRCDHSGSCDELLSSKGVSCDEDGEARKDREEEPGDR